MNTKTNVIYDNVRQTLDNEFGSDYGDGYTVTDVIIGYAEPGYGSDEEIVVLGNWNPKRFPREGEEPLTHEENLGPRLAEELSLIGANTEWLDEWTSCGNCHRAMRVEPDSYGWKLYGLFLEGEYVCADCIRQDMDFYLESYINDPERAITWCDSQALELEGWTQWESHNPHAYESGFFPGQNDDPKIILAYIHKWEPNSEVVFLIDNVGQFDIRFSAFIRNN